MDAKALSSWISTISGQLHRIQGVHKAHSIILTFTGSEMSVPTRKSSSQLLKERAVFDLTNEKLGLVRDLLLEALEKIFSLGVKSGSLQTLQYLAFCSTLVSDRKEALAAGKNPTLEILLVEEHQEMMDLLSDVLDLEEKFAWVAIGDNASLFAALAEDSLLINSVINFCHLSMHQYALSTAAQPTKIRRPKWPCQYSAVSCPYQHCHTHHRSHRPSQDEPRTKERAFGKFDAGETSSAPSSLFAEFEGMDHPKEMELDTFSTDEEDEEDIDDESTTEEEETRPYKHRKSHHHLHQQSRMEFKAKHPQRVKREAPVEGEKKKKKKPKSSESSQPTFLNWWRYQTGEIGGEEPTQGSVGVPSLDQDAWEKEEGQEALKEKPKLSSSLYPGDRSVETIDEWHKIQVNVKNAKEKNLKYSGPRMVRTRWVKTDTHFPLGSVTSHARWQKIHHMQGDQLEHQRGGDEIAIAGEGEVEEKEKAQFGSGVERSSWHNLQGRRLRDDSREEARLKRREDEGEEEEEEEEEDSNEALPRSPHALLKHLHQHQQQQRQQHQQQQQQQQQRQQERSESGEGGSWPPRLGSHHLQPLEQQQQQQQQHQAHHFQVMRKGALESSWTFPVPVPGQKAAPSSTTLASPLLPPSIAGHAASLGGQTTTTTSAAEGSPSEGKKREVPSSPTAHFFPPASSSAPFPSSSSPSQHYAHASIHLPHPASPGPQSKT